MLNLRIIKMFSNVKKYIILNVFFQILGLIANILYIIQIIDLIKNIYLHQNILNNIILAICFISLKVIFIYFSKKMGYKSGSNVKYLLREKLYNKIYALNQEEINKIKPGEIIQLANEGINNLDVYFSGYIPQLFYSLIAPLILFIYFMTINIKVAIILLIFVPLIPISIMIVQKIAKKLLAKYWGKYNDLSNTFYDNLKGMKTIKNFNNEQEFNDKMNDEAQNFRKITMKVLTMQLNSVTIMDICAYGGASAGLIVSVIAYQQQEINLLQAMIISLLAAEFFIPMRILGSFFHISMNGMAACEKLFKILDLKTIIVQKVEDKFQKLEIKNINYNQEQRKILTNINLLIKQNQLISIVGKSGSGKTTLAKIIIKQINDYQGIYLYNDQETKNLDLNEKILYVANDSILFDETIRFNLDPLNDFSDEELNNLLKKLKLNDLNLNYKLINNGSNISGGQRQRLIIGRSLLQNHEILIYDEPTSNVDRQSEEVINNILKELKNTKTIIVITHKLTKTDISDKIIVLDQGKIVEEGTYNHLITINGLFKKIYEKQQRLEMVGSDENN